MNESDIVGLVFVVIGLLCLLGALYASPIFVVVSGGFIAAGIVLIISAGNMCRARQDVALGKDRVYAELEVSKAVAKKTTNAPSLVQIPA